MSPPSRPPARAPDTNLQADYTASGNTGTTTLRFNTPAANAININGKWMVINAILVTPNMGAVNSYIWSGNGTFSGGAHFPDYSASNTQQEYVWQNNLLGYFIDNGALANGRGDAATALTSYIQAGPGTVVMSTNTYSGPYTGTNFLNGGFTVITGDSSLGVPGAAAGVLLSGGTLVGNATMTLDNGGLNPRPIGLLAQGGGLAAVAGNILTVDGAISGGTGSGPLIIGIPASAANGNVAGLLPGSGANTANPTPVYGTGTVSLTAANTYTGGTVLDTGVLSIGGGSLGTGGVTFNGGTLQWTAASPDISTQTVYPQFRWRHAGCQWQNHHIGQFDRQRRQRRVDGDELRGARRGRIVFEWREFLHRRHDRELGRGLGRRRHHCRQCHLEQRFLCGVEQQFVADGFRHGHLE